MYIIHYVQSIHIDRQIKLKRCRFFFHQGSILKIPAVSYFIVRQMLNFKQKLIFALFRRLYTNGKQYQFPYQWNDKAKIAHTCLVTVLLRYGSTSLSISCIIYSYGHYENLDDRQLLHSVAVAPSYNSNSLKIIIHTTLPVLSVRAIYVRLPLLNASLLQLHYRHSYSQLQ